VDADYERNADETLTALGPDGLREQAARAADEWVLLEGGDVKKTRDAAEFGLAAGERLIPGERRKIDRYRALRRRVDALDDAG
jgi:hypothetical protein